jgi:hypothetical protein
MNGWGTLDKMTDGNGDSIYTATLSIATGPITFKFRYKDGSAAADQWESVTDRPYTVVTGGGTFSAYYNDDSVYNPQLPVTVNFACNMELERVSGRFNPVTDTVSVRGDINAWGHTYMTPNPLNTDIYEASVNVNKAVGEAINFKFFYKTPLVDNWESGDNRNHVFTAPELSAGSYDFSASFNNGTLETVLNDSAVIKFTVFTTGAISSVNGLPFSPINTVHIAGSALPLQWPAGGWPNADSIRMIKLYDDGTNGDATGADGVFSRNITIPAYTPLNIDYKYSINFGDSLVNGGGNDNENGFGNNHLLPMTRYMTAATTVDTFGIMGTSHLASVSSPTPVEFRANMRVAILKGRFVPSEDTLYVAGSMNGWGTADKMTDANNDSIYTVTIDPAGNAGDTLQFKFRFREGDPGADQWESLDNRKFGIPPSGDAIFTAYYDNDSIYVPTTNIAFSFSCNMELERLSGRFNPATDTVAARGGFNGWGRSDMTPNPLNPDIYEVTTNVVAGVGEQVQFKFFYKTPTTDNWESGGNRTYTITTPDFNTASASYSASFNNGTLSTVLNQPALIKFTVLTTGAISSVNGLPFSPINTVHIAGSQLPLQWPASGWPDADTIRVIKMFDDGTNGDVASGDGVFSLDLTFPPYTILNVEYKYSINFADAVNNQGGNDNENGFGSNHILPLARFMTGGTTVDTFGTMGTTTLANVTLLNVEAAYNNRWNLVSVPSGAAQQLKTDVFPTATSPAYAFIPPYTAKDTLDVGKGYWVKFGSAQTVAFSGTAVISAIVPVKAGWNLVGSIAVSTLTSSLSTSPTAGQISSPFYGYNSGYGVVTSLEPGFGYWVKIASDCNLIIDQTAAPSAIGAPRLPIEDASSITITDAEGNSQTLYLDADGSLDLSAAELPPAPPAGIFDARFSTGKMMEMLKNGSARVVVTSAQYPLTVTWNAKSGQGLTLMTGTKATPMAAAGSVVVNRPEDAISVSSSGIIEVPRNFALDQNYPNPFNPTTSIGFALPTDSRVTVKIYNLIGQEVATLFDGVKESGWHNLKWDAASAPSGIYFYRMNAVSTTDAKASFGETRKMMLMK